MSSTLNDDTLTVRCDGMTGRQGCTATLGPFHLERGPTQPDGQPGFIVRIVGEVAALVEHGWSQCRRPKNEQTRLNPGGNHFCPDHWRWRRDGDPVDARSAEEFARDSAPPVATAPDPAAPDADTLLPIPSDAVAAGALLGALVDLAGPLAPYLEPAVSAVLAASPSPDEARVVLDELVEVNVLIQEQIDRVAAYLADADTPTFAGETGEERDRAMDEARRRVVAVLNGHGLSAVEKVAVLNRAAGNRLATVVAAERMCVHDRGGYRPAQASNTPEAP